MSWQPHTTEPRWLPIARGYLGVREIPGPQHAPVIMGWLRRLKAEWLGGDETPWCGTFCAAVLDEVGVPLPANWFRARAWLDWGARIVGEPIPGCIAVLERGPKFGHVGFVVGQTSAGDLLLLGGNQGNAVTVAAFARSRVLDLRWPSREPIPAVTQLAVREAPRSTSEA